MGFCLPSGEDDLWKDSDLFLAANIGKVSVIECNEVADLVVIFVDDGTQNHIDEAEAASARALAQAGLQAFFSIRGVVNKNDVWSGKSPFNGFEIWNMQGTFSVFGMLCTEDFVGYWPGNQQCSALEAITKLKRSLMVLVPVIG